MPKSDIPEPPAGSLFSDKEDVTIPAASQEESPPKTAPRLKRRPDGREPSERAVGPRKVPRRNLYQDEIYGSKEPSPLAVALIDTPEFQRLGHIYQLGMTHVIFRGTNHRRLDHLARKLPRPSQPR
jgi:hypothetical protein